MAKRTHRNQLRIIGGKWRGRKLHFPELQELRPTGDRVRETLFNWLAGQVEGARCLDLFAGSGALGFEAASRGALEVLLIDRQREVTANLLAMKTALAADEITVLRDGAMHWLQQTALRAGNGNKRFEIVFLDPPFAFDGLMDLLAALENSHCLSGHAHIYLETPLGRTVTPPANWQLLKAKQAGQVEYRLFERRVPALVSDGLDTVP